MADKRSEAGRILKLGIDEMFEDLTYSVAYDQVLSKLKNSGMDDGILKDAINSGVTIMFSAALVKYIQLQESVVNKIMSIVYAGVVALLSPLGRYAKNKLSNIKGVKLNRMLGFLTGNFSDRIGVAKVFVECGNQIINTNNSNSSALQNVNTVINQRQHILETKNQEFNYAKAKVDNINQTLLFKLFSSRFTPQDKEILRRITGSDKIDIDALNHVADFMFVTDDAGNVLGLSEMFITMMNGLGYFNGKVKKNGS
ncbi:hypothetical protein [Campylobacter concisus]|jgi:hypothetical protein|uniref:hypothetical protein n=1 Tax=Campylobacter concisus TaxID=199 RepID=UPI000D2F586C|nr:hypothetical protein [Campylobacter concisus]